MDMFGLLARTPHAVRQVQSAFSTILPKSLTPNTTDWQVHAAGHLALVAPHVALDDRTDDGVAWARQGRLDDAVDDLPRRYRENRHALFNQLANDDVLAVWQEKSQELVLARGALGQSSLFYLCSDDFIFFGSNYGWLLKVAGQLELDYESAHSYLSFGRARLGKSLAKGIHSVPAGHFVSFAHGRLVGTTRYYTPLADEVSKVLNTAEKQSFLDLLDSTICHHHVDSHGVLLSGGVDSSYVVATLAEKFGSARVKAFTIKFDAPYRHNETAYARLAAEQSGVSLTEVSMSVSDALAGLKHVLALDEPCSAWASITHYHMLKTMAEAGIHTVHSGLGADEVLGGYHRYLEYYAKIRLLEEDAPQLDKVSISQHLINATSRSARQLFPGVPRFFSDPVLKKALQPPFNAWDYTADLVAFYRESLAIKSNAHLFELMIAHECQHRIPDLLFTSFEPLARSFNLQFHYPFLDQAVVKVACGLGAAERFWLLDGRWKNKRLWKELAANKVPSEIILRKPQSYNAPMFIWMADPIFSDYVYAGLESPVLVRLGLIRAEWQRELIAALKDAVRYPNKSSMQVLEQAWALLTLSAWCEKHEL